MKDSLICRGFPKPQGLYDARNEHDACGIGFVANISRRKSHDIILKGIEILINLTHRGACGCDPRTGDGAGVLIQIPHAKPRAVSTNTWGAKPACASQLAISSVGTNAPLPRGEGVPLRRLH